MVGACLSLVKRFLCPCLQYQTAEELRRPEESVGGGPAAVFNGRHGHSDPARIESPDGSSGGLAAQVAPGDPDGNAPAVLAPGGGDSDVVFPFFDAVFCGIKSAFAVGDEVDHIFACEIRIKEKIHAVVIPDVGVGESTAVVDLRRKGLFHPHIHRQEFIISPQSAAALDLHGDA